MYLDVFRESSCFNFRLSNQSSLYVFGVFVDSRMGGPLINVFLMVHFDVFRQTTHFNFRPSKQSSFYVFGVFVDSIGRMTPDKRISEGIF